MREEFDGKVVMCCTSINDRFNDIPGKEESYIDIEFNVDADNPSNKDSVMLYSSKYKGRTDLLGKKVRVIVEVEE